MKMARINARFIFPICIFFICLIYLFTAKDLIIGTMKRPGVGFLPITAGTIAAIFSLIEAIKSYLDKNQPSALNIKWGKLGLFFLVAILYTLVINSIGYELATFGLLFALAKLFGAKSWIKPLIFSAVLSLASYYVFAELLLVPLP